MSPRPLLTSDAEDRDPELDRLAARLRRMREQRGQTMDELAALAGMSKAYLSRLESGVRQPTAGALISLARAWGISAGALFDQSDEHGDERVVRTAAVRWTGDSEGGGTVSVGSGEVAGTYTAGTRALGEGINPEELVGAAEAACFTMSLATILTEAGHPPQALDVDAGVHAERTAGGYRVTRIDLVVCASAAGIAAAELQRLALQAKRASPVSRALAGVEIAVTTELAD